MKKLMLFAAPKKNRKGKEKSPTKQPLHVNYPKSDSKFCVLESIIISKMKR